MAEDVVERVARALYVASGGDLQVFPWPCARADHWRKLARAAIAEVDADWIVSGWAERDAAARD